MIEDDIQDDKILIPTESFTAFRLLYGDMDTISKVSSTVLLGSIPILCHKEQKASLVKKLSKKSYGGIQRGVCDIIGIKNEIELLVAKNTESRKTGKLLFKILGDSADTSSENEVNEESEEELGDSDSDNDHNKPSLIRDSTLKTPCKSTLRTRRTCSIQTAAKPGNSSKLTITANNATQSFKTALSNNFTLGNKYPLPTLIEDQGDNDSIVIWSPESHLNKGKLSDTLQPYKLQQNVRFSDSLPRKFKSSTFVKNLLHKSEESLNIEPSAPIYHNVKRDVKEVARRTKARLKTEIRTKNRRCFFRRMNRLFKPGEIIKTEKMLVMVKELEKGTITEFTDSEPCDTRIVERWKQYIVIARATGDIDNPILIQFYTNGSAPHDMNTKHSNNRMYFYFGSKCLVNFYNSLDKTISIVKGDKALILRCQTASSSVRWLTILQMTIGKFPPKTMNINLSGLNISLNDNLSQDLLNSAKMDMPEKLILKVKDRGYHRENISVIECLREEISTHISRLADSAVGKKVNQGESVLGFSWRHYDRLEWVFGEATKNLFWQQCMAYTHNLELRRIEHYPINANSISEPTTVEGFLARLTTNKGHKEHGIFRKQVFAFSYFFTSDHLLFYCFSCKSLPPLPYSDDVLKYKIIEGRHNSICETLNSKIPQVYHHNPYEVDLNGHLTWLKNGMDEKEFWKRDKYATYEFDRKLAMITRAEGFIDLNDVVSIDSHNYKKFPVAVDTANSLAWKNSVEVDPELSKDCYFEITTNNGTSIVLRAPYPSVKEEWIKRLRLLKEYWTLRVQQDTDRLRYVKETNIKQLRIDDYTEANITGSKSNWENLKAIADAQIHNITPYSIFRPIIRSGFLYLKPKKHSSFMKYYVVLIPRFVIVYQSFDRSVTGTVKKTTSHEHYFTIPISNSYIYSGNICEADLIETENKFSAQIPGQKSLPRAYSDGWLSADDESSRCFTLWFGMKRAIAGKNKVTAHVGENLHGFSKENAPKNPGLIKLVSKFGVTGRSMIFMCRSRQEKDLWVGNLCTQLERFAQSSVDF